MAIVSDYTDNHVTKLPCRTSALTRELWVHEVLTGNPRRAHFTTHPQTLSLNHLPTSST